MHEVGAASVFGKLAFAATRNSLYVAVVMRFVRSGSQID